MTLMHRHITQISAWLVMLSVVMMAPSAGLITLTIPDETSAVASIPDTQHIAKRAIDDMRYIALDAIGAGGGINPQLLHWEPVSEQPFLKKPDGIPAIAQIRGPPVG